MAAEARDTQFLVIGQDPFCHDGGYEAAQLMSRHINKPIGYREGGEVRILNTDGTIESGNLLQGYEVLTDTPKGYIITGE